MQMRVKRLLQTGEYYRENSTRVLKADVRFILASTRNLEEEPFRSTFSRDLYYHLMVNMITMPPLRERMDDLPLLANVFLKEAVEKTGKRIEGIAPELLDFLRTYDFPDNMQELRNIVEGSVANTESSLLTVDSLPAFIRSRIESLAAGAPAGFRPRPLREIIREHVLRTYAFCGEDKLKTAAELEISLEEMEGHLR
jgi:DNA-binding NtrC family response regulator